MVHAGLDSALPLTEYIESRYFPRLEQRIELSGANHVEPSTLKGYRDIFKNHISGFPKRPCATLIKSMLRLCSNRCRKNYRTTRI
jgi:hypothetical protein